MGLTKLSPPCNFNYFGYSEEGERCDLSHLDIRNKYYISPYTTYCGAPFSIIRYTPEPELIQYINYYWEALNNDGYSFFLQIDEEGYDNDSDINFIFGYGSLYLYKHNETGEIIAGFWQCS